MYNQQCSNFSDGNYINVFHESQGIETVITKLMPSYKDEENDNDEIFYRQDRAPEASYIHETSDLFYLDTSTFVNINKCLFH
jgi:hypothetical protein